MRRVSSRITILDRSALGQKRTYAAQQVMSALPPIATAKADMPQMVMSAFCFGPKADIAQLGS
jgi:hypothetical protein